MSAERSHQDIEELLGAYALDAVGPDERELVELHLRNCPRCRAEVTEHREVAALLAHSGAPAPEGVWDRILQELESAPPPLRMPPVPAIVPVRRAGVDESSPPSSSNAAVVHLARRPPSVRKRTLAAVAGVAAVVIAVLGIVAVRQTQRLDRLDAGMQDVSIDRAGARALRDPQAANATLRSLNGRVEAPVVVDRAGSGFLFVSKLPELPSGRTYQLWGKVRGSVISLGVFDGGAGVVPFHVGRGQRAGLEAILVTEEIAPGVAVTQNQPLIAGAV